MPTLVYVMHQKSMRWRSWCFLTESIATLRCQLSAFLQMFQINFQRFLNFLHALTFPVRVPRIHLVPGRDRQPTSRRTETDATPATDSRRWRHNITATSQSVAANAGQPVLATAGVHDGRQRGLDKSTQTTATAAASTRWEACLHSKANDSHLWTNVQGKNQGKVPVIKW